MTTRKKKPVELDLWGQPILSEPEPNGNIIPLDFETHAVRMVVGKDNSPWWVASDVCQILDLSTGARNVREQLDDDETATYQEACGTTDVINGIRYDAVLVNEPGLYTLIINSRKPEAKRFKRWITHEVIPTIRKTGSYSLPKGRIAQIQKQLGCDLRTAEVRKDQYEINCRQAKGLASQGACPNDYKAWHNAGYRGQFDRTASELRSIVGVESSETPLDYMAEVPLSCNKHAKILAERIIKDAAEPISLERQPAILEMVAREMSKADLDRLGKGYIYGVIDDERRGRIIDVVNRQITHTG